MLNFYFLDYINGFFEYQINWIKVIDVSQRAIQMRFESIYDEFDKIVNKVAI